MHLFFRRFAPFRYETTGFENLYSDIDLVEVVLILLNMHFAVCTPTGSAHLFTVLSQLIVGPHHRGSSSGMYEEHLQLDIKSHSFASIWKEHFMDLN